MQPEFKRRRTAEATPSDLDGLSDQLQSVSLVISAALDRETNLDETNHKSMEELRQWYQTEVFAATDAQQQRWEERRWAFLGQLQHVLRRPLTHTAFAYSVDALLNEDMNPRDGHAPSSAFGGLLFVGRSRYNDIVVADETVSRVHCIIVRSIGTSHPKYSVMRKTFYRNCGRI